MKRWAQRWGQAVDRAGAWGKAGRPQQAEKLLALEREVEEKRLLVNRELIEFKCDEIQSQNLARVRADVKVGGESRVGLAEAADRLDLERMARALVLGGGRLEWDQETPPLEKNGCDPQEFLPRILQRFYGFLVLEQGGRSARLREAVEAGRGRVRGLREALGRGLGHQPPAFLN